MISPFETFEEFSTAEGPIYTFANSPAVIGILLVICLLLSLYFVYASFVIKKGASNAQNPMFLGIVIATGALSLADHLYSNHIRGSDYPRGEAALHRPTANVTQSDKAASRNTHSNFQPLALLGLVGGGTATHRRKSRRPQRYAAIRKRRVR
jgi:apolipoprotein N-acyltransferase